MSRRFALVAGLSLVMMKSLAGSQSASVPSTSQRQIVTRVAPVYPELAKRLHIHGVVKVEAVVRTNGTVKSTRALGGNPVLIDAAMEAVRKWKFEVAQTETTELVQVAFTAE